MRIFLTGHKGLLGNAIYRELNKKKNLKLQTTEKAV